MASVGRDLQAHPVPAPSGPGCSEPPPAWPGRMSVFLTGRRVLEERSSTQEHGADCSWSTLGLGCGDQVVIPTSTAQPLGKHCQAVVGKGMGPSCRTAHLPLPPQSLRAGCDEVSLDISTNYLISYFHFEQSLF